MSNIQYTIRNVPEDLDRRLRLRSKKSGQSFNATLIQALHATTISTKEAGSSSDIDWLYGSGGIGQEELDAFAQQRIVDKNAWGAE